MAAVESAADGGAVVGEPDGGGDEFVSEVDEGAVAVIFLRQVESYTHIISTMPISHQWKDLSQLYLFVLMMLFYGRGSQGRWREESVIIDDKVVQKIKQEFQQLRGVVRKLSSSLWTRMCYSFCWVRMRLEVREQRGERWWRQQAIRMRTSCRQFCCCPREYSSYFQGQTPINCLRTGRVTQLPIFYFFIFRNAQNFFSLKLSFHPARLTYPYIISWLRFSRVRKLSICLIFMGKTLRFSFKKLRLRFPCRQQGLYYSFSFLLSFLPRLRGLLGQCSRDSGSEGGGGRGWRKGVESSGWAEGEVGCTRVESSRLLMMWKTLHIFGEEQCGRGIRVQQKGRALQQLEKPFSMGFLYYQIQIIVDPLPPPKQKQNLKHVQRKQTLITAAVHPSVNKSWC